MESKTRGLHEESGVARPMSHPSSPDHSGSRPVELCPNGEVWGDDVSELDYSASHAHLEDNHPKIPSLPQEKLLLLENDQLKNHLEDLRSGRDILRQQLSDTRDELDSARTNFQERIDNLQKELLSVQLHQNRRLEHASTSILRDEIEEWQSLQKEVQAASPSLSDTSPVKQEQQESSPLKERIPQLHSQVKQLQEQLQEQQEHRFAREAQMEQEVLEAKEQAESVCQQLEEAQRQVDRFHQEVSISNADLDEQDDEGKDNGRVVLLQSQRTELSQRVHQLLEEIGQLRTERTSFLHQTKEQVRKIEGLEKKGTELQQESNVGEALLCRQMQEWKNRSKGFEKELKVTQRSAGKHTEELLTDRTLLTQRIKEFEDETKDLKERQDKDRRQWNSERRLYKRTVQSLEDKVKELRIRDVDAPTEESKDLGNTLKEREENKVVSNPPSGERPLGTLSSPWCEAGFTPRTRMQVDESDLEFRDSREAALRAQLVELAQTAEVALLDAEKSKERMEMLQSYLDATTSISPSKLKELEILSREVPLALIRTFLEEAKANKQPEKELSAMHQRLEEEKKNLWVRRKARIQKVKDAEQAFSESQSSQLSLGSCRRQLFCDDASDEMSQVQTMQTKLDDELSVLTRKKEKLRKSRAERLTAEKTEAVPSAALSRPPNEESADRAEDSNSTSTSSDATSKATDVLPRAPADLKQDVTEPASQGSRINTFNSDALLSDKSVDDDDKQNRAELLLKKDQRILEEPHSQADNEKKNSDTEAPSRGLIPQEEETFQLKQENQRLVAENKRFSDERSTLETKLSELSKQLDEVYTRENLVKKDLNSLNENFKSATADSDERKEALQVKLSQIESEAAKHREQVGVLDDEIARLNEENTRIVSDKKKSLEEKASLEATLASVSADSDESKEALQDKLSQIEFEAVEHRGQVGVRDDEIARLNGENTRIASDKRRLLEEKASEATQASASADSDKSKEALQDKLSQIELEAAKHREQVGVRDDEIARLNEENTRIASDKRKLLEEKSSLEATLSSVSADSDERQKALQDKLSQTESEAAKHREQVGVLDDEIARLNEENTRIASDKRKLLKESVAYLEATLASASVNSDERKEALQDKLSQIESEAANHREQVGVLDNEIARLNEANTGIASDKRKLLEEKASLKATLASVSATSDDRQEALQDKLSQIESEAAKHREQVGARDDEIARLHEENTRIASDKRKLLEESVAYLEATLASVSANSNERKEALQDKLSQIELEAAKHREQVGVLDKEIARLREENTRIASDKRKVLEEKASLEAMLASVSANSDESKEALQDKLAQIESEAAKHREQVAARDDEIARLHEENTRIASDKRKLLEESVAYLEATLASVSANSNERKEALQDKLSQIEFEAAKHREQVGVLDNEIARLNEENTRIASDKRKVLVEKASLEATLANVSANSHERQEALQGKLSQTELEAAKHREQVGALDHEIARLHEEKTRIASDKRKVLEEKASLEATLASVSADSDESKEALQDKLSQIESEAVEHRGQVGVLDDEIARLNEENTRIASDKRKVLEEKASLEATLESVSANSDEKKEALQDKLSQIESEAAKHREQVGVLDDEIARLHEENTRIAFDKRRLLEEKASLEATLASVSANSDERQEALQDKLSQIQSEAAKHREQVGALDDELQQREFALTTLAEVSQEVLGLQSTIENLLVVKASLEDQHLLRDDEEHLQRDFVSSFLTELSRSEIQVNELQATKEALENQQLLRDDEEHLQRDFAFSFLKELSQREIQVKDLQSTVEKFEAAKEALEDQQLLRDDEEHLQRDFAFSFLKELSQREIQVKDLQSTVENFEAMKEALEDQLQLRNDEEHLQRDSALAELSQREIQVNDLQSTATNLEAMKEALEDQLQLRDDEEHLQRDFALSFLTELSQREIQVSDLQSSVTNLEAIKEALEDQLQLRDDEEHLQRDFGSRMLVAVSQSVSQVNELEATKEVLEDQQLLRDDMEHLQQDFVSSLLVSTSLSETQVNELQSTIESLEATNEVLLEDLEISKGRNDGMTSQVSVLKADVAVLEKAKTELEEEKRGLRTQIEALNNEKGTLKVERDEMSTRIERQQERLESACAQLNDMEDQIADLDNENDSLKSEHEARSLQVERQQEKLENACMQMNDMEESLLSRQDELETAELRVKALEGEVYHLEEQKKELEEESKKLSTANEEAKPDQKIVSRALFSLPTEATSRESASSSEANERQKELSELLAGRQRDLDEARLQIDSLKAEADAWKQEREILKEQEERLMMELHAIKEESYKQRAELETAHTKVEEITSREAAALKQSQKSKEELEAVMVEADQRQWEVQDSIAGYRNELDEKHERIRQLTSNVEKAQSEASNLKRTKRVLLEDLEISNERNDDMAARIDVLETMIGLLETAKEGLEEQLQSMEGGLQTKIDDLQKMRDELEAQLQEMEGEESMHQDLINSLSTELLQTSALESSSRTELENAKGTKAQDNPRCTHHVPMSNPSPEIHQLTQRGAELKGEKEVRLLHIEKVFQDSELLLKVAIGGMKRLRFQKEKMQAKITTFSEDQGQLWGQNKLLETQVEEQQDEMAAVVVESEKILRRESGLVQELHEASSKLQAATIEADQRYGEMEESLGMRLQELEDARWLNKDLAAQIEKLQTTADAREKTKQQMTKKLQSVEGESTESRNTISNLSSELSRARTQESMLRKELIDYKYKLELSTVEMTKRLQDTQLELEKSNEQSRRLQSPIIEMQSLIDTLKNENRSLLDWKNQNEQKEGDAARANHIEFQEVKSKLEAAVAEADERQKQTEKSLLQTENQLNAADSGNKALNSQIDEWRKKNSGLSEEKTQLLEDRGVLEQQCSDFREALRAASSKLEEVCVREKNSTSEFNERHKKTKEVLAVTTRKLEEAIASNQEMSSQMEKMNFKINSLNEEKKRLIEEMSCSMEQQGTVLRDELSSVVKKFESVCARENKLKSDLDECKSDFTLLQLTSVARTITTEARLSSQKKKLEESLEREKNLQSRYGVYKAELASLHESFNRKQKALEENWLVCRENLDIETSQNDELKQQIKAVQVMAKDLQEHKQEAAKENELLRAQTDQLFLAKASFESDLVQVAGERDVFMANDTKRNIEIDALVLANDELQKSMHSRSVGFSEKLEAAFNRNALLEARLEVVDGGIVDFEAQIEKMEESREWEIEAAARREEELSENVEACKSRTEALEIEARHQREELEKSLTHLKTDIEGARDTMEKLRGRGSALESEKEQLIDECGSLKEEVLQVKREMEEVRQERDGFTERDDRLKKDIGSLWGW
jgi:chromosome segregation ATPase